MAEFIANCASFLFPSPNVSAIYLDIKLGTQPTYLDRAENQASCIPRDHNCAKSECNRMSASSKNMTPNSASEAFFVIDGKSLESRLLHCYLSQQVRLLDVAFRGTFVLIDVITQTLDQAARGGKNAICARFGVMGARTERSEQLENVGFSRPRAPYPLRGSIPRPPIFSNKFRLFSAIAKGPVMGPVLRCDLRGFGFLFLIEGEWASIIFRSRLFSSAR